MSQQRFNVKPRTLAAARSKLESDQIITTEHIQQTINSLPLHKTPGEDGFPSDWYRAFAQELSPLLRDMYLECEQDKQMTELMRSAVTSLVYKNKGSRQDLSKYRPLTVTPTEYKILAKAMQLALTPVLQHVIAHWTLAAWFPTREIHRGSNCACATSQRLLRAAPPPWPLTPP